MSLGCGTLAHKFGHNIGIEKASRSNGHQHGLPENANHGRHAQNNIEDIEAHWSIEGQKKGPTRLWGVAKKTVMGGEERQDACAHQWTEGEYYNVDSNIRKWGLHQIKRNAAAQNHDVHRHDQIQRIVLPPKPGSDKKPRQCVSGVVSPDCCFLEAWGFDLGLRDRQANHAPLWKPVNQGMMFRSLRSYDRNVPRMLENYRTLRKTASVPGSVLAHTLRPEDVGGEAGELSNIDDATMLKAGRTYGSRSCYGWDTYDNTCRREASKMACGIHSPSFKTHNQDYPFKDDLELNPASVYTKKFQSTGEVGLRTRTMKSMRATRH
eukprot:TRINITY_DN5681_c0_g1_i1.p1 TRINITY_DN5681_c0_g1~~TRINITY_DN5681_c0_g1_i1.p1  ORF type:complete len:322 (-),score=41.43 TRINITY_DN5681_c0_g1_i1:819-1784(-)